MMKPDTPKFATYRYPQNGYPAHQETAKAHLKLGRTYTVEREEVGNFHTDVFLMAFPGIAFNSVMFDIVPVIMGAAAPKPDCVGVEELCQQVFDAVGCDRQSHKGLISAIVKYLASERLLAVKEKAQTAEDDLRMFGQSFERISEDGKRTRISPLDVYDKAQERGEHPCDWQDEENKGGRS